MYYKKKIPNFFYFNQSLIIYAGLFHLNVRPFAKFLQRTCLGFRICTKKKERKFYTILKEKIRHVQRVYLTSKRVFNTNLTF